MKIEGIGDRTSEDRRNEYRRKDARMGGGKEKWK
jgi:hypothetical protein